MQMKTILGVSLALGLGLATGAAQQSSEVEQLRKQLEQANEAFQKAVEQHRQTIDALSRRIEVLGGAVGATNGLVRSTNTTGQPSPGAAALGGKPWSPSDPIRLGSGASYVDLSLVGLFAVGGSTAEDIEDLEPGAHDPQQRGFSIQNVELTLSGAVDPYFRGRANLIYQLDAEGESTFELEEAYMESISLPWNLQVKGGQYFSEFGRLNPTHPHSWDFVDQPLVNARFLGGDGLRNPGARVSWLAPTPFYSELFVGAQNSQGETAESFRSDHEGDLYLGRPAVETRVRNLGDLLYTARYALSFNPGDEHTLLAGVSGAWGPNASGEDTDTRLYGLDLFYKWKSKQHSKGFPFVTWQTEWMFRDYQAGAWAGDAGNPAVSTQTLRDSGLYSQVSWGFHRGWVASLRGDYVSGADGLFGSGPETIERWRLSPALTFHPSEFSRLRLQYNRDDREGLGIDHSVWLQFEFLLGAHAAHKF
jgi:type II secretory pathway pseudopilin PulG